MRLIQLITIPCFVYDQFDCIISGKQHRLVPTGWLGTGYSNVTSRQCGFTERLEFFKGYGWQAQAQGPAQNLAGVATVGATGAAVDGSQKRFRSQRDTELPHP